MLNKWKFSYFIIIKLCMLQKQRINNNNENSLKQ